jgi:hypothetical protein
VAFEPFLPRPSDLWREYELIEELGELVGIDVVEYVRLGAFAEDLFVHSNPILALRHVVGHDRITPSHMERKRDDTGGCWLTIELLGYRDRTSCGSERAIARSCHYTKSTTVVSIALSKAKWRCRTQDSKDSTTAQPCP